MADDSRQPCFDATPDEFHAVQDISLLESTADLQPDPQEPFRGHAAVHGTMRLEREIVEFPGSAGANLVGVRRFPPPNGAKRKILFIRRTAVCPTSLARIVFIIIRSILHCAWMHRIPLLTRQACHGAAMA